MMWDIGEDGYDSFQGTKILDFATIDGGCVVMMEKEIIKKSLD